VIHPKTAIFEPVNPGRQGWNGTTFLMMASLFFATELKGDDIPDDGQFIWEAWLQLTGCHNGNASLILSFSSIGTKHS